MAKTSAFAAEAIKDVLNALEQRYRLRSGFLRELKEDPNDWSFLVRLQSFLEALLADAVVARAGHPKLRDYVQGMNVGGNRGLVAMAVALDVLSDEHARFLKVFASTRNTFAHRIANIDRSLEQYVEELPKSQRTELWIAVMFHKEGEPWEQPKEEPWTLGALIRDFFWLGGLIVATQLDGTISERERLDIITKIHDSATKLEPYNLGLGLVSDVEGGGLLGLRETGPAG